MKVPRSYNYIKKKPVALAFKSKFTAINVMRYSPASGVNRLITKEHIVKIKSLFTLVLYHIALVNQL